MKQGELDSLAHSLCHFLTSRNNDIAGYWGLGVLAAASQMQPKPTFRFRIRPGQSIVIGGSEIGHSNVVTEKLIKCKLDSIEGRLSFFKDGQYPHGVAKYTGTIAIAVAQDGRVGIGLMRVQCWLHDPTRESRRHVAPT